MKTSQLLLVSSEVSASSASRRGCAIAWRTRVKPPVKGSKASISASSSADHSTRWATISNGGTLPTARKYSGARPQVTKAASAANMPWRAKRAAAAAASAVGRGAGVRVEDKGGLEKA